MAYEPILPYSPSVLRNGTTLVREKASQTFKRGALLKADANGYFQTCTDAADAATNLAAIAAEPGHNASADGEPLQVYLVSKDNEHDLFEITLVEAQDLAAFAFGDADATLDAVLGGDGFWRATNAASVSHNFRFRGFVEKVGNVIGTTTGMRILVSINASAV